VRITGGLYKGRIVKMPKGILRPAMDRMRESMFAVIGPLKGCSFLDMFSGSGVVALEAASRGADPVVLVEKDIKKKPVLNENILIAADTDIRVLYMPAERFIRTTSETFDYIHLDPPFPLQNKIALLELIDAAPLLASGGTITIHYPKEDNLPPQVAGLKRYDLRTYGRSYLAFFTKQTE
jgi:16S rRNA (guanine966-N2)-methyltransferase